ncbi:hypothetical protein EOD39_14720 [Acipenser ruthenus]|uniref:Uncharacterized protein n=1 Tax=Acipenser ruthenus TaxID=7906 RepID=A0A662YM15_ACIRT|nr:hypothetical protein EOD39_14719 [Acipenser ruthenus]RXM97206.1 hypothetical protein EOD39_14720 [Acipenser ruthenus]
MYATVEFTNENTVEVVPRNWISSEDEMLYSYWSRSNPTKRAKRKELPDKEKWLKYPLRGFVYSETYGKAVKYADRARETSNVEMDTEND